VSTIVGRWGKSLAIRIPTEIADAAELAEGERVEIEARDGTILIRRAVPHFSLSALFDGRTPEEWRDAYSGAFDWGPDLGRELIEE
jgi:antitoxin MazE